MLHEPEASALSQGLGSCALVSSSDVLLDGRSRAEEIDSYDEVVRVNLAPTVNFESRVGRRTSLAVTNAPSWLTPAHKLSHNTSVDAWAAHLDRLRAPPLDVIITDPMCVDDSFKCLRRAPTFWGLYHRQAYCQKMLSHAHGRCARLARAWPNAIRSCVRLPDADLKTAWRHVVREASSSSSPPSPSSGPREASTGFGCSVFAPSTGLLAAVHLRRRCASLRLFGFAGRPSRRGHYWKPDMNLRNEVNLTIEHALVQRWRSLRPASSLSAA